MRPARGSGAVEQRRHEQARGDNADSAAGEVRPDEDGGPVRAVVAADRRGDRPAEDERPGARVPSSPRNTSSSSRLRVAAVAASSTTVPPSDHPNARRGPTREATHAVPSAPTRYPKALTVFIRPAVVNDHPRSVRMAGNNKA